MGGDRTYRRANKLCEPLDETVEGVLREVLWERLVETGDDGL
jgi:hypothetical protein